MNQGNRSDSTPTLLMRLDLATEVLEGMEELGIETKGELLALLEVLERQIDEEG